MIKRVPTDSGEHEQLRRANGARGQDDLSVDFNQGRDVESIEEHGFNPPRLLVDVEFRDL